MYNSIQSAATRRHANIHLLAGLVVSPVNGVVPSTPVADADVFSAPVPFPPTKPLMITPPTPTVVIVKTSVTDPTTTSVPPGASDTGVPSTVIAGSPGASVCEPKTKPEEGFCVMAVSPGSVRIAGGESCVTTIPPGRVSTAGVAGRAVPRGTVKDPIMTAVAPRARETGVPDNVIAEAPGTRVCELKTKAEDESWVMVDPPGSVRTTRGAGSRGIVDDPMTTTVAAGATETGVPDNVIAGLPGRRVCVPITKAEDGLAVMGVSETVMTGAAVAKLPTGCSGTAELPISRAVADGASDRGVPSTVMPGLPGARVWVPMMKAEADFAVSTELEMVMGGRVPWTGVDEMVEVPIISAVALGSRE